MISKLHLKLCEPKYLLGISVVMEKFYAELGELLEEKRKPYKDNYGRLECKGGE